MKIYYISSKLKANFSHWKFIRAKSRENVLESNFPFRADECRSFEKSHEKNQPSEISKSSFFLWQFFLGNFFKLKLSTLFSVSNKRFPSTKCLVSFGASPRWIKVDMLTAVSTRMRINANHANHSFQWCIVFRRLFVDGF